MHQEKNIHVNHCLKCHLQSCHPCVVLFVNCIETSYKQLQLKIIIYELKANLQREKLEFTNIHKMHVIYVNSLQRMIGR
jgi:hypothetical protein